MRVPEKKDINKKYFLFSSVQVVTLLKQNVLRGYISPICPEALSEWICTKFGVILADVINCAKIFVDWFRVIYFVRG